MSNKYIKEQEETTGQNSDHQSGNGQNYNNTGQDNNPIQPVETQKDAGNDKKN